MYYPYRDKPNCTPVKEHEKLQLFKNKCACFSVLNKIKCFALYLFWKGGFDLIHPSRPIDVEYIYGFVGLGGVCKQSR